MTDLRRPMGPGSTIPTRGGIGRNFFGRAVALAILMLVVATIPFWPGLNTFIVAAVVRALLFIALGQAWNIIAGICGQLSLGHGVFFGIGAYGTAMFFNYLGISPWIGAWLTAGVAAAVALLMGLATLRFKGVYFGLATIVISLGFERLTRHFVEFTGGDSGFVETFLGDSLVAAQSRSPGPFLWAGVLMVTVFYVLTRWILTSRFGLQMQSVRDDEEAAAAAGVMVFRTKLLGFILSAVMTSLVGSVYLQFYLAIDPSSAFGLYQGIQIQLPALLGGLGTAAGPVIGGAIMIFISECANWASSRLQVYGLDVLAFGVLLLLIVLWLPGGILGGLTEKFRKRKRVQ